ncbi:hypothetical protein [Kitasatospora sp. NPDC047058]|uniref:hypothetical protein n=1 Tax=Kitasatospora sp. NPDC047058 TaxID=3155620 RepID=UPI0033F7446A
MPEVDQSFARNRQATSTLRVRTVVGIVLGVAALVGCDPSGAATTPAEGPSIPGSVAANTAPTASTPVTPTPAAGPAATSLSFSYHALGKQEYIDQTLSIGNDGQASVVPTLTITAVDGSGRELPDVQVTTAYGSDRGSLVIQPGGGYDVLAFHGADAKNVADVKVTVKELAAADLPESASGVEAQPADAAGKPLTKFDPFDQVILKNPNSTAVSVRIVYLVYDQPSAGTPQQAIEAVPIGGLITVPPAGTTPVAVSGDAKSAVRKYSGGPAVSVKTYFSR